MHLFFLSLIVPAMETETTANTAYQAMLEEGKRRRKRALELKNEGKTDAEIGVVLKVSRERARQLVKAARKDEATATQS